MHSTLFLKDISIVWTPISTHEQLLEREFDGLCNKAGFNPFGWLDQILGLLGVNYESNLVNIGQSWQKSSSGSNLILKHENYFFGRILTSFDSWSTQGWLEAFWSIWSEKTLWVLRCLNVRHNNLNVFVAPRRIVNIFGIFGVRHANWGRTKYSIYGSLWHSLDIKFSQWYSNASS